MRDEVLRARDWILAVLVGGGDRHEPGTLPLCQVQTASVDRADSESADQWSQLARELFAQSPGGCGNHGRVGIRPGLPCEHLTESVFALAVAWHRLNDQRDSILASRVLSEESLRTPGRTLHRSSRNRLLRTFPDNR